MKKRFKKMKPTKSYYESLIKTLKDPEEAVEYLNAALEDGDESVFLSALKSVAEAHGGMAKLSHVTKLNRANLYKAFSRHGNPEIQTLAHVLHAFGLRLAVAAA
jgi:probable addiction module antidote protein